MRFDHPSVLQMDESKKAIEKRVMVVIPTYNEAENIPQLLKALFELPVENLQVLLIDDNSPDGTGAMAEQLGNDLYGGKVTVIHREGKQGLGTAYIRGFMYALTQDIDYVIQMDADFSHNPTYLPQFATLLEDFDVVVGSRYIQGGSLDARWGLSRRLLSRWASFYSRTILGLKVQDSTAGFKMFRRAVLEQLPLEDLRSNGYCFQLEIAYLCQTYGFRVTELPIHFNERAAGVSKMSVRVAFESAWKTWVIKLKYRKPLDKNSAVLAWNESASRHTS